MNNRTDLKDVLRQMLAVMEKERQAIAGLDLDAITGCSSNKFALCDQLGHISNDDLDDECRSLIDAAKRLNEVNRQIRNLVAANVTARLDALTGAPAIYRMQGAHSAHSRYSKAPAA